MKPENQPATQKFSLRSLEHKDAEQLRELHRKSIRLNKDGFIQDLDHHGDIYVRAESYQRDGGCMVGMFDDDVLIGFGGLKKSTQPETVELCNLHLEPDYQGQGLGKQIALHLMDQARGLNYKMIVLHVTITQQNAIGLYQRLGFKEFDRKIYNVKDQNFDTVFMEFQL